MFKNLVSLVLLSSISSLALSQDNVFDVKEKKDSMNYNKVMIIPFNPDLYFSDSDPDLAEYNRKTIPQIRHMFRYGLDLDINVRILSKYDTKPMLRDTSQEAADDLQAIYSGLSYKYEKLNRQEKKSLADNPLIQNTKNKIKNGLEETDDSEAAQKATTVVEEESSSKKYMNVVPHDPEMLAYLEGKYGTDLFLFINQFELKTNYEQCLDRANKIFQRQLLVHYSIYNQYGDQIAGNVITVHFPSNSNDMDQIIRRNFPVISNHLTAELPKPRKVIFD